MLVDSTLPSGKNLVDGTVRSSMKLLMLALRLGATIEKERVALRGVKARLVHLGRP